MAMNSKKVIKFIGGPSDGSNQLIDSSIDLGAEVGTRYASNSKIEAVYQRVITRIRWDGKTEETYSFVHSRPAEEVPQDALNVAEKLEDADQ